MRPKGLGSIRQLGVRRIDPPARGHLDHVRELAVKGPAEAGSSWALPMITDATPVCLKVHRVKGGQACWRVANALISHRIACCGRRPASPSLNSLVITRPSRLVSWGRPENRPIGLVRCPNGAGPILLSASGDRSGHLGVDVLGRALRSGWLAPSCVLRLTCRE